jgi:phytoene dehydrogenase-like protein
MVMAERFDIVVAGAGHNSLIAAAYLAKAGYKCVVLEGRPIVGGGVKSAQLTLRGFTHDMCSSAHNGIHGNPAVNLENPSIHVICCSIADPTRAPAGMHTLKIVAYHPYELKEGPQHWDEIKDQVSDASLQFLRRFSPNLTDDKMLARIVESPLDLERMNPHNWHGSCHAGGSGPAQTGAMRPVAG